MTLQTPRFQELALHCGRALHWRLAFAAVAVAVGAACMDGYPTQDALHVDPFAMTQHQRLAHMNALGDGAHPDGKWSYDLLPGCVLRIDFDGPAGPRAAGDIPLLGATVKVATDKVDATFDVEVQPASPTTLAVTKVLEARDWADAIGMSKLLRTVEKECTHE